MRSVILERSEGLCELRIPNVCTGWANRSPHHRKLRSQGGQNTMSNLVAVCGPCHSHAHLHRYLAFRFGWIVKSYDDPAQVPIGTNPDLVFE